MNGKAMFLYSYNELQNVQHENKDLEVDSHINLYTADFASHFINRNKINSTLIKSTL